MRDVAWAGIAAMSVFILAVVLLQTPLLGPADQMPELQQTYILVGAPILTFGIVLLQVRVARRRREVVQRAPRGARLAMTLVALAVLIGINATGVMLARDQAEGLQSFLDCEPTQGERGRSVINMAGPEPSQDPTGLLIPSTAGASAGTSSQADVGAVRSVTAVGDWPEAIRRLSVVVRLDGEWFAGDTVDAPRSGENLTFSFNRGDYDAIQWEAELVGTATQDHAIVIEWQTQGC